MALSITLTCLPVKDLHPLTLTARHAGDDTWIL